VGAAATAAPLRRSECRETRVAEGLLIGSPRVSRLWGEGWGCQGDHPARSRHAGGSPPNRVRPKERGRSPSRLAPRRSHLTGSTVRLSGDHVGTQHAKDKAS